MKHKVVVDMPFRGKFRRVILLDEKLSERQILNEFQSDQTILEHADFLRDVLYKASSEEKGHMLSFSSFTKKKFKVDGACHRGIATLDVLLFGGANDIS